MDGNRMRKVEAARGSPGAAPPKMQCMQHMSTSHDHLSTTHIQRLQLHS